MQHDVLMYICIVGWLNQAYIHSIFAVRKLKTSSQPRRVVLFQIPHVSDGIAICLSLLA